MKLNAQQVHVWEMNLGASIEETQANVLLLSKDEIKRARRLHLLHHQHRFINARATLRRILAHYLAVPPREIHFIYRHRKPTIASPETKISFNLSHSHDQALYAIANDIELGIDIEKIRPIDYHGVARRCFSLSEIRALTQSHDQKDIFYRVWSRKEAVLKSVGDAHHISPASFSVPTHALGGTVLLPSKCLKVLSLNHFPGYAAALAMNQHIEFIDYFRLLAGFPQLVHSYDPYIIKKMFN